MLMFLLLLLLFLLLLLLQLQQVFLLTLLLRLFLLSLLLQQLLFLIFLRNHFLFYTTRSVLQRYILFFYCKPMIIMRAYQCWVYNTIHHYNDQTLIASTVQVRSWLFKLMPQIVFAVFFLLRFSRLTSCILGNLHHLKQLKRWLSLIRTFIKNFHFWTLGSTPTLY